MAFDPLPPLDRTSATFKADLDALFLTKLPLFSIQAEALRVEVAANAGAANTAAVTATGQAAIAVEKAGFTASDAEATAGDRIQIGLDRTQADLSASSALASKSAAADSAAAATAAKDKAIEAWAAAVYPADTLPAISKSIHWGAIVKAIIYDASKDSDPGWVKRCQHTSWYQEPLGFTGVWRGQLATAAAAWAVSGAAAGDGYQNTADGKYYVLTGVSAQTEIVRGNRPDFPVPALIVVETARVVICDPTQSGCPMWMVIKNGARGGGTGLWYSNSATSAAAGNGCLYIGLGGSNDTNGGLLTFNFITDVINRKIATYTAYAGTYPAGIGARMLDLALTPNNTQLLVNSAINDVAITVLDNAPIDPATGLPVPTIAVATAGGVSVIKQDGTVANHAFVGYVADRVNISKDVLRYSNGNNLYGYRYIGLSGLPSTFAGTGVFTSGSYTTTGNLTSRNNYAVANSSTLMATLIQENPSAPTKSMIAAITPVHNSGWQVGDSRGAYLADTTAETITASGELVTNGTFTTDTSGWTTGAFSALSVASGALVLTHDATASGTAYATQMLSAVVGKTYTVTFDFIKGTATSCISYIATGNNAGVYVTGPTLTASGSVALSFVATTTTPWLMLVISTAANVTGSFDNISVKLAEPDRSVKNMGLVVNGTLTKAAVASGANLVAYSGFSAANYLEQPYNANLDFGTGDFCVMGWANLSANTYTLFDRGTAGAGRIALYASSTNLAVVCSATAAVIDTGVARPVGLTFFAVVRASGILSVRINGNQIYSGANVENVSNALAAFRVGLRYTGDVPSNDSSISLLRISATAPSADQIAHIYRTELPLFQANAQCTIAGTSTAVTALAYDDVTGLLHVGTSWGRSGFKYLLRVDSEATTTGAITSLSANQGALLTGGTSAKYYQPAILLRDELRRKDEAKKALGKVPVFFDFDAASFNSQTMSGSASLTASGIVGTPYIGMGIAGAGIPAGTTIISISGADYTMSANATVTNAGAVAIAQISFTLQQGYTTQAVYSAGALKRMGASKDYLIAHDGFRETVNFGMSQGSAAWVSIMATRSN